MKSRFYVKINPNFCFKKILLNKQTGFQFDENTQKLLYHYDDKNIIKRYNYETKQNNHNDNQILKALSKYKNQIIRMIKNKNENNTSLDKKSSDISSIRSKLLRNNNKMKQIDFNVSSTSDQEKELKLNIGHYLFQNKINSNNSRNFGSQKKIKNYQSENNKNNYDISLPYKKNELLTNKSHRHIKYEKLYLPYIPTNIIRKSKNMKSLMQKVNNKSYTYKNCKNIEIETFTTPKETKNEKDIFKNINYFIDNKKSTIKINDIKRNIDTINNHENEEEDFTPKIVKRKSSTIRDSKIDINQNDNEKNQGSDIINEELNRKKEGDRFMIYENCKKYIDTDKIYNSRKFCMANIPNVSLDKDIKNIEKFESIVKSMKNTKLDLAISVKLSNN